MLFGFNEMKQKQKNNNNNNKLKSLKKRGSQFSSKIFLRKQTENKLEWKQQAIFEEREIERVI